jgi:hypothetical protein
MKLLSLKYLMLFTILLFSRESNKLLLSHDKNELSEITNSQLSVNQSPEKHCLNLEFKNSRSRPTNQGQKVETIVISCIGSNYSKIKSINLSILQKKVFSKKNHFLSSPYYLLISQTFHISTLINILRI